MSLACAARVHVGIQRHAHAHCTRMLRTSWLPSGASLACFPCQTTYSTARKVRPPLYRGGGAVESQHTADCLPHLAGACVDLRHTRWQLPAGEVKLSELFGAHDQLVVQHFMFPTEWEKACASCSMWADGYVGMLPHLSRKMALALVAQAPQAKLAPFKKWKGWTVPMVSSARNTFNKDFGVEFTGDEVRACPVVACGTAMAQRRLRWRRAACLGRTGVQAATLQLHARVAARRNPRPWLLGVLQGTRRRRVLHVRRLRARHGTGER